MHDVFETVDRSDEVPLAASLACFAVAGATNASIGAGNGALVGVGFAVAGVYALARYARSVTRKRLATRSLALWWAFLAIAVVHGFGLETAAGAVLGSTPALVATIEGATWGTLLGAGGSTAFLALREYDARTSAGTPEERVLDGEFDC